MWNWGRVGTGFESGDPNSSVASKPFVLIIKG